MSTLYGLCFGIEGNGARGREDKIGRSGGSKIELLVFAPSNILSHLEHNFVCEQN